MNQPRVRRQTTPQKPGLWKKAWRVGIWLIWDLPGFRWIWEHVRPETEQSKKGKRPAPTITLWLLGTYTALFGMASNRYENIVDRYELRANAVIALLANDKIRPLACWQIGRIQDNTVPIKPILFDPRSLRTFWQDGSYKEGIYLLKSAVESCKGNLSGADLRMADLSRADLSDANLRGAGLNDADLQGINLLRADLSKAYMYGVDLRKANLVQADLRDSMLGGAILISANMSRANLRGANLRTAHIGAADLRGADLSGADIGKLREWRSVKSWKKTNIYEVKNAPEGFREYVLARGGIEEAPKEE